MNERVTLDIDGVYWLKLEVILPLEIECTFNLKVEIGMEILDIL